MKKITTITSIIVLLFLIFVVIEMIFAPQKKAKYFINNFIYITKEKMVMSYQGLFNIKINQPAFYIQYSNGKHQIFKYPDVVVLSKSSNANYRKVATYLMWKFVRNKQFLAKYFNYIPYQLLYVTNSFTFNKYEIDGFIFLNEVNTTGGEWCWGINGIPSESNNIFINSEMINNCIVVTNFRRLP